MEFVYASEEFPEWSGTQFADGFVFFVDNINYAALADGRPVSLLRQEDNIHFMTNGDPVDPTVPAVAELEYDGLTRVLELTAPLTAGVRNHITIAVGDTGDEIYDSAVFLSSLRFLAGTTPLPVADLGVKVRHKSEDDAFQEHELENGDFNGDGYVDAADYVVWRKGLGTAYSLNQYNIWRDHYGLAIVTGATGSGSFAVNTPIPEPATITLFLLGGVPMLLRHYRTL
jgi:hypothetical protein